VGVWKSPPEGIMMEIHVENLGELVVIECKGRIVRDQSVFELRDVVLAQTGARIIVLDLSRVEAIGGAGLGMLAFLNRRARERNVQFKLLDPSRAVVAELVHTRSILDFEIASFHQMMKILRAADKECAVAA